MGLYASFTPETLGYPVSLEQEILGDVITVDVDYMEACEAFVATFLDEATSLVPVDTGYLQSTIDASTDGFFCEAEATAEYAQYVEYGTWKMDAQPYFEPAINAGLEAFHDLAGEALDQAQEMLEDICQSIMESAMAEFGGDGGFLGDLGGILAGGLMLLLLFPVMLYAYAIFDTIFGNNDKDSRGGGGGGIDIIIT